jgi:hypothetical protein
MSHVDATKSDGDARLTWSEPCTQSFGAVRPGGESVRLASPDENLTSSMLLQEDRQRNYKKISGSWRPRAQERRPVPP